MDDDLPHSIAEVAHIKLVPTTIDRYMKDRRWKNGLIKKLMF